MLYDCRAFPNARSLAKDGAAEVLVEALRTSTSTGSETTSALCSTLRLIAANDEICQQAAGAGAVALAMQVQESAVAQSNPSLARAALSLLRQLASSDAVKAAMLEGGSMPAVKSALDFAGDAAEAAVAEAALGFLANLALRNPDASKAAVEEGCAPAIVQTMRSMLALCSSAGGPKAAGRAPAALRQGCMAVRNMAVRSEEARAALLEAGAEAVVRQARAEAPTGCGDVGSAALRDMGLDDYQ